MFSSSAAEQTELFRRAPAPLLVVDAAGMITDVNEAAVSLLERSGLVLGVPLTDLLADDESVPSTWPAVAPSPIELRFRVPQGEPVPVRATAVSVDEAPGPSYVFLEDLRELHDERARVATLEARLSIAADVAGFASWSWNLEDGTVEWSDGVYEILGRDRSFKPTLESFAALIHPEDRDEYRRRVAAGREGEGTGGLILRIVRPDGDLRRLFGCAVPVRSGAGPVHLVGAVQDVTDRTVTAMEITALHATSEGLRTWMAGGSVEDLMAAVGRGFGCAAVLLWVPEPEETALRYRSLWHAEDFDAGKLEAAVAGSTSLAGETVLDRSWHDRHARAVDCRAEAETSVSLAAAADSGLDGCFVVPLARQGRTVGCLQVLTRDHVPETERLVETLTMLGESIGRFMAAHALDPADCPITPRELAVLQLAAQGMSGTDIGLSLGVSLSTVKTHFEKIYAKLAVHDRGQAVAEGLRRGLIV